MAQATPLYPTAPPQPTVVYPTQPSAYPAPSSVPAPSGPPPAYVEGAQPQPTTTTHHTTVIVQEQKPAAQPQPKKKGMFSSFMKEVDKVGKKFNDAVDKNVSNSLLDLFATNNVLQLVPKSTSKTVQILLNDQGHMMLDANGDLDPRLFNSLWTVINDGSNQVRLHNNNNYLAVIKGCTTIAPIVPGVSLGLDTKFQLSIINSQYLTLESLSEREKFVAFYSTGQIKPANKRDLDCHFAIKLVSTPYPGGHPAVK